MKKLAKNVIGMTALGAGLGIGASVVEKIGGTTAGYAGAGMTTMASFMPSIGAVMGGGMVLEQTQKLQKMVKKRKHGK